MLIDFHTHAFPDAIAPRALGLLIERMEKRQGESILPAADGTAAGLLRLMEEEQIDKSVLLPIATRPQNTASVNRFSKSLESGKIVPFGSVHPMQEDWEAALEEAAACGFPGIKLHPEFQEFFVDSPESVRVLKKCAALKLIVVFHAGEDVGYEPPVHCTPLRLLSAMDAAPGVTVVAAHMGGFRMWDDVAKYLADSPCYIDTAYVQKEMPADTCLDLIRLFGAERVLFASDSPWSRPRTESWAFLENLGLSGAEKNLISHENAFRLLESRK